MPADARRFEPLPPISGTMLLPMHLHSALAPALCTVCCAWPARTTLPRAHRTQCVHKRCPLSLRGVDAPRSPLQLAYADFNVSSQPAITVRAGNQAT